MHLRTETVTSPHAYQRRRDELLGLYARCGAPWSAVAHPDWVAAWWKSRPPSTDMVCCLVRADGQLVGAFPIEFTRRFKMPPTRAAGSNLAWGWSSALVDPMTDVAWADALMGWLAGARWSVAELGLFRAASPASSRVLATHTPSAWHEDLFARDIATIELDGSFDEFVAGRTRNLRRKYRRAMRSADEQGIQARAHIQPTPQQLHDVIGTVSRRSWQGSSNVAVYSERANRTFYSLLASQPGELQLALHYREDDSGEPLGYMLSIRAGDVMHQIDTGFDPAAAESSPGLLATFDNLRWACDEGLLRVDMGIAADYKKRFGPEIQTGQGVVITRGLAGRIVRTRS